MNCLILSIGRLKSGAEYDLFWRYAKLIGGQNWRLTLKEHEVKTGGSPAERMAKEGALLLSGIPEKAAVIALDERGEELSSRGFAGKLSSLQERGEVIFVIGGADGLSDEVKKRAHLVLSLGPMTWPHALVRSLLAEQLYRAKTILTNHPYHRD